MAKGKHSRALFEVIKQTQERQQQERRDPSPAAAGGGTPFSATAPRATRSSWLAFLRRPPVVDIGDPRAAGHAKPVAARVVYREISDDGRPTDAADAAEPREAPFAEPEHADASSAVEEPSAEPVVAAERTMLCDGADAAVAASDLAPPAAPRQVHVTLSYAGVGIATAAGVILLVSAFLVGKHFARPPYAGNGPSLAQIKGGKAFPDVLNVGSASPRSAVTGAPESADEIDIFGASGAAPPPPQIAAAPTGGDASSAPAGATDGRRVANRNYIIAQSYPDREIADKAAGLLNRNNIPVSVEQLDYAPGWFCVVTRVGFDRVKTQEYERYEKLIRDVNVQAVQARLKKFDPYPYKWK